MVSLCFEMRVVFHAFFHAFFTAMGNGSSEDYSRGWHMFFLSWSDTIC